MADKPEEPDVWHNIPLCHNIICQALLSLNCKFNLARVILGIHMICGPLLLLKRVLSYNYYLNH